MNKKTFLPQTLYTDGDKVYVLCGNTPQTWKADPEHCDKKGHFRNVFTQDYCLKKLSELEPITKEDAKVLVNRECCRQKASANSKIDDAIEHGDFYNVSIFSEDDRLLARGTMSAEFGGSMDVRANGTADWIKFTKINNPAFFFWQDVSTHDWDNFVMNGTSITLGQEIRISKLELPPALAGL